MKSGLGKLLGAARLGVGRMKASGTDATTHLLIEDGEALAVGAGLGVAHVMLPNGLDWAVNDTTKLPIDALAAVGLGLVSLGGSGTPMAHHARHASAAAASVYAFRMAYNLSARAANKATPPRLVHGSFGTERMFGSFYGEDSTMDPAAEHHLLNALRHV